MFFIIFMYSQFLMFYFYLNPLYQTTFNRFEYSISIKVPAKYEAIETVRYFPYLENIDDLGRAAPGYLFIPENSDSVFIAWDNIHVFDTGVVIEGDTVYSFRVRFLRGNADRMSFQVMLDGDKVLDEDFDVIDADVAWKIEGGEFVMHTWWFLKNDYEKMAMGQK